MATILEKIVSHKREEVATARRVRPLASLKAQIRDLPAPRDFLRALQFPRALDFPRIAVALIAEVKKASPTRGVIRAEFDPLEIAGVYRDSGADCLSVLTDEAFFQGHLDYLRSIRASVELPLLRKDFVIDEYQVVEARAAGADAVLLIAECLEPAQMVELHQSIGDWGMTTLIELYDERHLPAVLDCRPRLVGVNNRDLHTFEVDFQRSLRIKPQLPADVLMVSESGIQTADDVRALAQAGIGAMLVGESLMRCHDLGGAVRQLLELK